MQLLLGDVALVDVGGDFGDGTVVEGDLGGLALDEHSVDGFGFAGQAHAVG